MRFAILAIGAALAAVLAGFSAPLPAAADTITVTVSPGCATISACIATANPGDTVFIPAGTYTESATLDKAVSLIGAGPDNTIWNAAAGDRVLTVTAPMTASNLIPNLMIRGGGLTNPQAGGGIWLLAGAEPRLRNLAVVSNTAPSGGGIFAQGGSESGRLNDRPERRPDRHRRRHQRDRLSIPDQHPDPQQYHQPRRGGRAG